MKSKNAAYGNNSAAIGSQKRVSGSLHCFSEEKKLESVAICVVFTLILAFLSVCVQDIIQINGVFRLCMGARS